jgi:hypothetical protein
LAIFTADNLVMKAAGHLVVLVGGFIVALLLPIGFYIPAIRSLAIGLGILAVILMLIGRKWARE